MKCELNKIFALDKKPKRGLLAAEWVMVAYMAVTLLLIFFTYTKLHNPESMLWGRLRIAVTTAALWAVYRLWPCRLMRFARVAVQMAVLSWWYPDTYEFNRMFPNLDHHFATWEQQLFGCQPAMLFCKALPGPVFSELMDLGYASYFPMILVVTVFFFLWRYKEFHRAAFVILASFFIYYVIYIALPVAGPQYYYKAIGMEAVAEGRFADVHEAGERPTAAFPSSHVGISTILLLLVWRARARRLLLCLLPFYVLLCLSTVYIYAHYAIDVLAGWASAVVLFAALSASTRKT